MNGTRMGVPCLAVGLLVGSGATRGGEVCGDDSIDGSELCETNQLGGESCTTLGFDGGSLGCLADCTFDTSGCTQCGNNSIEGGEACDGTDLGGESCTTLGFDGGSLGCLPDCTFDTSGCTQCGNNSIEGSEVCDGTDLPDETCASLGLGGGPLGCLPDCSGFDTSGCFVIQVPGDFDGNGVVDLSDHAAFVDCLSGPGNAPNPLPPITVQECMDVFDFDSDLDVDLLNFSEFTMAFADG